MNSPKLKQGRVVTGITGESISILKSPGKERRKSEFMEIHKVSIDYALVRKQLEEIYKTGIKSVAISLLHSFTFQGRNFVNLKVQLILNYLRARKENWQNCRISRIHKHFIILRNHANDQNRP